ncbi:Leucine-rich repeat-containing protein 4 [Holothuria leucospilota]|uniref:Leucine-rich repeat-containing protein 4 n=1 Tax=Holothuria leucospilota TaxID=206669 RepID=A0A9Q0YNP1_HOLLE|nr:Leucine-rich repeat-containing protein 4 [Holothuria leucospilota]
MEIVPVTTKRYFGLKVCERLLLNKGGMKMLFFSAEVFFFLNLAFGNNRNDEACRKCSCFTYYHGYSVNCSNRWLHSVPDGIPPNVTKLNLSRNYLSALSEDLFMRLRNLVVLDLSVNSITNISKGCFAYNVRLKKLDISENQLTDLPSGLLFNNHDLKTILFKKNSLRNIPETIFANIPNLTHVDISHDNCLQELPPGLLFNNHYLITM